MIILKPNATKFIRNARSTDETRWNMTAPFALDVDGERWIASTDGHRIHMVRASGLTVDGYVCVTEDGEVIPWPERDGRPPDIVQVMPPKRDGDRYCLVPTDEVRAMTAGFDSSSKTPLRLHVDDPFVITSYEWPLKDGDAYVVPAYVHQALEPFGDLVAFRWFDDFSPIEITSETEPQIRALIMPIRVDFARPRPEAAGS